MYLELSALGLRGEGKSLFRDNPAYRFGEV